MRTKRNNGTLSDDRIAKLDAIGFVWKSTRGKNSDGLGIDTAWQAHFDELVRFKEKTGDCKVPTRWEENRGLGIWVSNQRQLKKLGKLSPEKEQMLNELGFIWNSRSREESR